MIQRKNHSLPPSNPSPARGIFSRLSCGPRSGIGKEGLGVVALALRALRCEAGFVDRGPRTFPTRGLVFWRLRGRYDDGGEFTSVSVEGREMESVAETSDQDESDHRRVQRGRESAGGGEDRNIPGRDGDDW